MWARERGIGKAGVREDRREGRNPGLVKLLSAWVEVARRREIRLIDAINPFMMILTSNSKDNERQMYQRFVIVETVRINDSENQRTKVTESDLTDRASAKGNTLYLPSARTT